MPHVDHQLSLRSTWVDHGTSPFARPVAAITEFVQSLPTRAGAAVGRWSTRLSAGTRAARRADPGWEMRQQEERYASAASLQALEGMERDFNRRQVESVRHWE